MEPPPFTSVGPCVDLSVPQHDVLLDGVWLPEKLASAHPFELVFDDPMARNMITSTDVIDFAVRVVGKLVPVTTLGERDWTTRYKASEGAEVSFDNCRNILRIWPRPLESNIRFELRTEDGLDFVVHYGHIAKTFWGVCGLTWLQRGKAPEWTWTPRDALVSLITGTLLAPGPPPVEYEQAGAAVLVDRYLERLFHFVSEPGKDRLTVAEKLIYSYDEDGLIDPRVRLLDKSVGDGKALCLSLHCTRDQFMRYFFDQKPIGIAEEEKGQQEEQEEEREYLIL